MNTFGLYIHIPFCQSKCLYCDFPSYCNLDSFITPYIDALKKELEMRASLYAQDKISSIFIGGGTPTYIHSRGIKEILKSVRENFSISPGAEISIEANPGTFDIEKLRDYKEIGINRMSIGLQAWQDSFLKQLGRIHTQQEFIEGFKNAKDAGFENINVDLIFGLPRQSLKDWQETLEQVVALRPTHVSCYGLIIEEGTPFDALQKKGMLHIDEDLEREMYYLAISYLKSFGYHHYEISNFAQPGFQCKHNLIYWDVKPYLGIGSSAHSHMNNKRFSNTSSVSEYIKNIQEGALPITEEHPLTAKEYMEEYMFLGLRKIEGISKEEFFHIFHKEIEEAYGNILKNLQRQKLINIDERICLTSKGLDYANYVFQSFLQD
ncbi:radical SAM family heme chaperone HemW [Irregularibacter muris]|uniref:Heme chaperone HemW n=1 Tax=Irregularibacter muris TaxID=1796619 RepID=A0AAE3L389_9FIRM|nr:radical SAM family heme chaperone HemW [Irregularibacter muris]MCR1897843.1 radical SAM family heme chaperone HemW [Irregularibacter muris]